MSLTYSTYVTAISTLTAIPSSNTDFTNILPDCIDYAEQRIYRELDLLQTTVVNSSSTLSSGNRSFNLPSSPAIYVVVDGINVITPAGNTPDQGARNQLTPVSLDVLNRIYPSAVGAGVPQFFAMVTQGQIVVGPWPDAAYTVEVIGTQRPAPLSLTNTTTFLATNLPDLFVAASMVFMSGYMRNYGSQSDDPRMSSSWEAQYQLLKTSAEVEEGRKKFASVSWTSKQPEPATAPQRG